MRGKTTEKAPMTPTPPPPPARLKRLVDRRLAGTISRVELAELETHLLTPDGLAYYLRCAEVEAGLTLLARARPMAAQAATLARLRATAPTAGRGTALLAVAAALALLVAAAALLSRMGRDAGPTPVAADTRVAATLLRQIGGTTAAVLPADFAPGEAISLDAGLAEISLPGGSTALVEGPGLITFSAADCLQLESGRVVLRSAPGAPPVHVSTAAGDIDCHPGEIAIEAAGAAARIVVIDGRAGVGAHTVGRRLSLEPGQSVEIQSGRAPRSIVLDPDDFLCRFPTRDLAWSAPEESFEPTWIEHDVSALIWSAGTHHARFKWMHGCDALQIERCELRLDGRRIATDAHNAMAGDPHHTRDATFSLRVPAGEYRRGRWTLHSRVRTNPRSLGQVQIPLARLPVTGGVIRADDPRLDRIRRQEMPDLSAAPDSHGVVLFDSAPTASREDACGTWEYHHAGDTFRRTFFPDGSARLEINGEHFPNLDAARWTFAEGVLTLRIYREAGGPLECIEQHLIRQDGTLSFLDRPYEDARRTR
jgi:hypothetical protein